MLVDFRLGDGVDGLAAIATLRRAFGPATSAVLISGESGEIELARIRDGGVPMLHKPLPPARLRSLLAHLSQTASQAQEPAANLSFG